jgi:hypothetical protein
MIETKIKFTTQDVADIKYAVAIMYEFSQQHKHEEGIKRWGVVAEKLSALFPSESGTVNDDEFIKQRAGRRHIL